MTKILSMVSCKNYNLDVNENFVIFFTFKLITCFIDCFISKRKSQSIAHLLNESDHVWKWSALKMSYMDKRPSRMQGLGQAWGAEALVFSVLPLHARPDEFKACRGYLERPAITAKLEFKLVHIRWSLTPISVGML